MSEILKLCQMFWKSRKKITTFELVFANSGICKKTEANSGNDQNFCSIWFYFLTCSMPIYYFLISPCLFLRRPRWHDFSNYLHSAIPFIILSQLMSDLYEELNFVYLTIPTFMLCHEYTCIPSYLSDFIKVGDIIRMEPRVYFILASEEKVLTFFIIFIYVHSNDVYIYLCVRNRLQY